MRTLRIAAATTATLVAIGVAAGTAVAADTVYSASVKLQEVISGGQTVSPTGNSGFPQLSVGYAYQIPDLASGQSAGFTVNSPAFQLDWKCSSSSTTGSWHVNVADSTRTVTSTAWWPSSDQHAASTLMNTVAVPNSCQGGNVTIKSTTFVNSFTSTVPNAANFRWHYVYCTSSTNCTNGAWTTTFAVTPVAGGVYPPPAVAGLHLTKPVVQPEKVPFTGAEIGGMVTAAVVLLGGGTLLLIAARRRRRERAAWR